MNRFQSFLNELSQALRFSTLQPDALGACLIVFHEKDASLLFEFDEQLVPNTVLISSALSPLPHENRIEILEECLKGNYSIEETLSCKPDEDLLYLHRRLHPDVQAKELEPLINEFLSRSLFWKKRIIEISKEPPKPYRFPLPPSQFQFPPFIVD